MKQVKDSLKWRDDSDFVFDKTNWYVVSKAESTNGWLRLTFGWRYWLYFQQLGSQLRRVAGKELSTRLDDEIGLVCASYEAGLRLGDLEACMPRLHFCAERLQRKTGNAALGNLARLLTDPIALLTEAIEIWSNDDGYINASFSGGGFGLGAAIEGMAIAHTLNTIVDAHNRSVEDQQMDLVRLPLTAGFQQLKATQRVLW